MDNNFNSKKVIKEIDLFLKKLNFCLKQKKEFEDVHKDIVRFFEVMSLSKKQYKGVEIYPLISTVSVSFGRKTIYMKNKKQSWEERKKLGDDIIKILDDIKKFYVLKLKLL